MGDIPNEDLQEFHRDKGKGDLETVTVYVKTEDDDFRLSLVAAGAKLRNRIKTLSLA